MKSIQTLSFSQLEEEMEALKEQDAQSCVGGGWFDYVHDLDEVIIYGPPIRGGGGGVGLFPNDFSPGYEDYENYGGAGGGYTPEETPPEPGPPLKLKNLPGMCRQANNTAECGMFAFDYLSKFYGGDRMGIHKDDFAEAIGHNQILALQRFSLPNSPGLDSWQYERIRDTFFNNTHLDGSVDQIKDALKSGNPIICSLSQGYGRTNNGIAEYAHAVVIVGYDEATNQITYADSLKGNRLQTVTYDASLFKYQDRIEGLKDSPEVNKYKYDKNDWWSKCQIDTQVN